MPTLCDDCALATFKEEYDERDQEVGMAIFRLMKTGKAQMLPSEKLRQWRRNGGGFREIDAYLRTEDVQSPRHREPPLLNDDDIGLFDMHDWNLALAKAMTLAWHGDLLKGNDCG